VISLVLIAPVGIEMTPVSTRVFQLNYVLIAPVGIEMTNRKNRFVEIVRFNRTSRN